MTTQEFWEKLQETDYKKTKPRLAFAEVLIENQSTMLSPENLYLKTKERFDKTNLSTIYRNLEALTALDVLYKLTTEDGNTLYKLKCASSEHHHHIICTRCGKVLEIHYCPFEKMSQLAAENGFIISEHRMELFGLCQDCQ